ncbi:MAG: DUF2520 domain-containing protein [Myxococcota bacterium]
MSAVVVVGRGRVGRTLARGWKRAGLSVRTLAGRAGKRPRRLPAGACVLAVPDAAIAAVAASLAGRLSPPSTLFHCAGARGPEALGPLPEGVFRGALHPMVSFADARRPPALRGTSFALSGDRHARRAGRRLIRRLGAVPVEAEGGRTLHGPAYHAAAALLANGSVALAAEARDVLTGKGVAPEEAERMLAALLASVAANVESLGLPGALTGPVARGDADTVQAHRRALGRGARATYDAVGEAILKVARAQGLSRSRAAAVAQALRGR